MEGQRVELTFAEIGKIIQKTSESTVNRTLEKLGLEKKTIRLSEVKQIYGRSLALKAELSSLKWVEAAHRGKGIEKHTSRAEFEKWLFGNNK